MKNIILILLLAYAFLNYNEVKTIDYSKEIKQNKNIIKQVSILTYGGELGSWDSYAFTKDSICYDFYLAGDTTQNAKRIFINDEQKWKKMIDVIDLSKFNKAINGKSNQEFDGTDITIKIIVEGRKDYSITNGEENKNWNAIYKEFRNQINEQNVTHNKIQ